MALHFGECLVTSKTSV